MPSSDAVSPEHIMSTHEAHRIRTASRAIIIRDGHLLTVVLEADGVRWNLLPGGGQDFREDRREALRRECREELGCDVVVGEVVGARDYVGANHEFSERDGWFHQSELWFSCQLAAGAEPVFTEHGDDLQVGIEWLDLADLESSTLFPAACRSWLTLAPNQRPFYLGDVS